MNVILIAVFVLGGIGLISAAVLFIASKKFAVWEDPRIKEVEDMLPHYNCGACGYAGCHEMAEKLVKGEEKNIAKCKPGKKDKNFDPILAYLSAHPSEEE